MQIEQAVNALRALVDLGVDRLQHLVVRFGIASIPADILLNCDEIVLALLALRC